MASRDTAETWTVGDADPDCEKTLRPETLSGSLEAEPVVLGPGLQPGREIGRGGMGVVLLARQGRIGREVAVKRIRDDVDAGAARQLLREARVTGFIEHPNVVPVHDVVPDAAGRPQIVLKRIEGRSWQDILDDPTTLPDDARDDPHAWHIGVLVAVCNALELAHQRGIVHRDLKPDNVMIGAFGEVYLMDWGIAVSLKPDPDGLLPTLEGQRGMVGTPLYMAPEMFQRDASRIGTHTDIYLLAGMLYRVLAGRPPREPGPLKAIHEAALAGPSLDPSWPEELLELLGRSFDRDPAQRPDAAGFRSALKHHLARRDGVRLLERVEARTAELFELLDAAGESEDPELHHRAHDLFGACRFGIQDVLERWPEDRRALALRDRVFERMLRHEIAQQDARAASLLLSQLPSPDPDLAAEVEELARRAERARARLARLDEQLSVATGFRARIAILIALGLVWIGLPVGLSVLGVPHGYGRALGLNLVTFGVACTAGLLFFGAMRRSRVNRGFLVLTLMLGALGMLELAVCWLLGLTPSQERVMRGVLATTLLWTAATLLDRRLLPTAAYYSVATLLAATLPAWAQPIMTSATVVLVVNGVLAWALLRRRGRRHVPVL
ncbi:MAG: serine/threonine protein kinase [Alphaproteobacteria bacterium]|nr:serine/threonine protein kinase [Alphaproteobacteria bacterium]MCB9693605.1 serine/threonine protein kinase [Alphaproteobacteria bacterium]